MIMWLGFGRKKQINAYIMATTSSGNRQGFGNAAEACHAVHALPAARLSSKVLRRAKARIAMVAICFSVIFSGLGLRLADISFSDDLLFTSHSYTAAADRQRSEIVDRNGVLLAINLPTYALEVAGKEVWDPHETAVTIAGVVEHVDAPLLEKKLARGQYVEVRSDLTPDEKDDAFALGLPGVRFARRDHRFYPQQGLAPHLIGHVEKGQVRAGEGGMMGLEKLLDRREQDGPLVASMDVRVQQVLEEVLTAGIDEFSAEAGWGGVMDVRTGEMIAMASFPEFNLNDPAAFSADARRNRMSYDRYDLGSAFKSITAASVIESGLADENTPYDARGGYYVAGITIRDYKGKNRVLTLSEVVQHSSNIGTSRMAHQLGPTMQQFYLDKLGMLAPLPIELAENRSPDLPRKWGPVEAATVSYGHGIAVTPLHLLAGFSAVVHPSGLYQVPTFLKAPKAITSRLVFKPGTTAKMRRVLRRTVTNGSAKRAEVAGYFPIGKTSTADKPGPGGYQKDARISTFAGAFPGYDPRYVVLVSLDNPKPTEKTYGYATAGWTAAPMFRKLVSRIGPMLEVPMVTEEVALEKFGMAAEGPYNQRKTISSLSRSQTIAGYAENAGALE